MDICRRRRAALPSSLASFLAVSAWARRRRAESSAARRLLIRTSSSGCEMGDMHTVHVIAMIAAMSAAATATPCCLGRRARRPLGACAGWWVVGGVPSGRGRRAGSASSSLPLPGSLDAVSGWPAIHHELRIKSWVVIVRYSVPRSTVSSTWLCGRPGSGSRRDSTTRPSTHVS